jgi:hypothetical protein
MKVRSIELVGQPLRQLEKNVCETSEMHSSIGRFFSKQTVDAKVALRRCESASSLHRRQTTQNNHNLSQLEVKYRTLEENYRKMLQ